MSMPFPPGLSDGDKGGEEKSRVRQYPAFYLPENSPHTCIQGQIRGCQFFLSEKTMATHSSTLAWKIPWTGEPGELQSMGSRSQTQLRDFPFSFHFHVLEKEMATHSSVLAWRIPGTEEPGGLLSMGSQSWTRLK